MADVSRNATAHDATDVDRAAPCDTPSTTADGATDTTAPRAMALSGAPAPACDTKTVAELVAAPPVATLLRDELADPGAFTFAAYLPRGRSGALPRGEALAGRTPPKCGDAWVATAPAVPAPAAGSHLGSRERRGERALWADAAFGSSGARTTLASTDPALAAPTRKGRTAPHRAAPRARH